MSAIFSANFTRVTTFMTSCVYCKLSPSEKRGILLKEFAPKEQILSFKRRPLLTTETKIFPSDSTAFRTGLKKPKIKGY